MIKYTIRLMYVSTHASLFFQIWITYRHLNSLNHQCNIHTWRNTKKSICGWGEATLHIMLYMKYKHREKPHLGARNTSYPNYSTNQAHTLQMAPYQCSKFSRCTIDKGSVTFETNCLQLYWLGDGGGTTTTTSRSLLGHLPPRPLGFRPT
jgi:hypothetical protein